SIDAIMMSVSLNNDGSIEGKYQQKYSANSAFLFRNNFSTGTEDSYLDDLEKKYGDIEISDFSLQNHGDLSKPVVQSFSFFKEAAYDEISGKLYVSPLFYLTTKSNPFKTEKREFPVDYGFPWKDQYIINITIPEGYVVESVPASIVVELPDNLGRFKYIASAVNNMVNLRVDIELNSPLIPSSYYSELKEFYNQIIKKELEQVILTKA
ncbi:MAG: transglutaminase, partial [Algicola sp.]|nr:transglutaminase [Algicola sp.]